MKYERSMIFWHVLLLPSPNTFSSVNICMILLKVPSSRYTDSSTLVSHYKFDQYMEMVLNHFYDFKMALTSASNIPIPFTGC